MRLYVLLSFAFCLTTLSWRLDSKRKALENHTTERLSKPFSNLYSISPRAQKPSEKTQLNFVSAPGDGHLYLNGALFDFRGFNVPTIFLGGEYQCRDLLKSILGFGTPVGRAYTLQVANDVFPEGRTPASSAHIIGWDKGSDDWIYNEANWRELDLVMDLSRQYGVKLIIPIINQDFGDPASDYFGNYNDLIRHRFHIKNYGVARKRVDWFTSHEMLRVYKKLITFFLNRVNTFNGIRYGDDDTILALETGNELNWGGTTGQSFSRPPPANWTLAVAEHLKSLAPNTLVMDGSFSRSPENAWDKDVLDSEYVELFSYHLYGEGDIELHDSLHQKVRDHKKTLVIGEHGFYADANVFRKAYSRFTCAGALAWSLRPHADTGGFLTNSEGYNIYSYHVPGWDTQATAMFDTQEAQVIGLTYNASYRLLGLEPPPRPIPGPPEPFLLTNGRQVGLSWRGSAWAKWYEVFGAAAKDSISAPVSNAVYDNVEAGELFVALDPQTPTKFLNATRHLGKTPESHSGWSDQKWCVAGSQGSCSFTIPSKDRQQAQSAVRLGHGLYTVVPRMNSTSAGNFNEGGWYSVRGISADGVPGEYSEAVFVGTDWV